jgi:hypothetical protein
MMMCCVGLAPDAHAPAGDAHSLHNQQAWHGSQSVDIMWYHCCLQKKSYRPNELHRLSLPKLSTGAFPQRTTPRNTNTIKHLMFLGAGSSFTWRLCPWCVCRMMGCRGILRSWFLPLCNLWFSWVTDCLKQFMLEDKLPAEGETIRRPACKDLFWGNRCSC